MFKIEPSLVRSTGLILVVSPSTSHVQAALLSSKSIAWFHAKLRMFTESAVSSTFSIGGVTSSSNQSRSPVEPPTVSMPWHCSMVSPVPRQPGAPRAPMRPVCHMPNCGLGVEQVPDVQSESE